jgi:hypothetical protein
MAARAAQARGGLLRCRCAEVGAGDAAAGRGGGVSGGGGYCRRASARHAPAGMPIPARACRAIGEARVAPGPPEHAWRDLDRILMAALTGTTTRRASVIPCPRARQAAPAPARGWGAHGAGTGCGRPYRAAGGTCGAAPGERGPEDGPAAGDLLPGVPALRRPRLPGLCRRCGPRPLLAALRAGRAGVRVGPRLDPSVSSDSRATCGMGRPRGLHPPPVPRCGDRPGGVVFDALCERQAAAAI